MRKSLVCVYVCVNILSHISRVAQPGLLCVLSPVAIGACARCIPSLHIIPLKLGISPHWAPACFPLLYPQHPSITTLPVGWMFSSPASKGSPAPWCLQCPVLCPLSPAVLCQEWDRGCGFAAGLWGAVALLGDRTQHWGGQRAAFGDILIPLCKAGGLVQTVLLGRGCSQQTLHCSCIPSLNDCGISFLPGNPPGGELPVPAHIGTLGCSGKMAVTMSLLPRLWEEQMWRCVHALADLRPKVSFFLLLGCFFFFSLKLF